MWMLGAGDDILKGNSGDFARSRCWISVMREGRAFRLGGGFQKQEMVGGDTKKVCRGSHSHYNI